MKKKRIIIIIVIIIILVILEIIGYNIFKGARVGNNEVAATAEATTVAAGDVAEEASTAATTVATEVASEEASTAATTEATTAATTEATTEVAYEEVSTESASTTSRIDVEKYRVSYDGCDSTEVWEPGESIDKKPVIYLYGYDNVKVNVKIQPSGTMLCTYPKYDSKKGWSVTAAKDGTLTDSNGLTYKYLFWEASSNADYTFDKGFCVLGSDTAKFLQDELTKLGLTQDEINDFIVYWLPQMQDNNYNVISFQTKVYTDDAKLTVTPKPDAMIRVFMAYYASDSKVKMTAQKFKVPSRKGKTVVEWGGAEVDEPETDADDEDTYEEKATTSTTSSSSEYTAPASTEAATTVAPVVQDADSQIRAAWNSTAALKCGKTWDQLDESTKQAARNHYAGHGTSGW